jgi:NAD(P)-dependent dehydrogenase (short-subunit alcohol dehydrogenase family)
VTASTRRGIAALAAGATIGATTAAGTALLLYTGQGFLRAVGLLISSTIMAVAAGVWAGAPDDRGAAVQTRARWAAVVVALLAGGAFAAVWMTRGPLRELAFGGALAVLLVLALPAYAAGALLAGIYAREQQGLARSEGGGIAAMSLAGAALGVLLATTVLIQNLEPYGIYYGAAGVLILLSVIEQRARTDSGVTDMRNHVAIITGVGSSGQLGFAVARRFLDAGARVLVTGISPEVEGLGRLLADDGRVIAVRADLTRDDDVDRLLAVVLERFGRLDSLINVAGGLSVMKSVADTTPTEWQRELQRNAETVLRMSRAALPALRAARGAIVNFASPAGVRAVANLGAYSAAKAGVIALTRALALEEKTHGVRVNAIAPGIIDTEENRAAMDRASFVSRDDVASVVLFLAGPDARGISGETIHVTGPTLT